MCDNRAMSDIDRECREAQRKNGIMIGSQILALRFFVVEITHE
jgi:hypothetical protein